MKTSTTRKGFLKRGAGGAVGVVAVTSVAGTATARADVSLDASYNSPYPPHPTIGYPSSWHIYTGLTPVVVPSGVFICNRELTPMPEIEGLPNLGHVPSDATLLCVYHQQMDPGFDVSGAIPLNGTAMRFSDLGGGTVDQAPVRAGFRRFVGTWAATVDGNVYQLQVFLFVGPGADSQWADVQPIVNTIKLPG